jgi:hypothetical protein
MDKIFIRTRKLTMRQLEEVSKWLDIHPTGPVTIRGAKHRIYIQQYVAEHDGNKRIHELKVEFFNETDARHFLMEWG